MEVLGYRAHVAHRLVLAVVAPRTQIEVIDGSDEIRANNGIDVGLGGPRRRRRPGSVASIELDSN